MYKFFKMTALCAALAAAGAAGAATITLDGTSLSIEDAWKIAAGEADVAIAPEAVKLLEDSHKLVMASAAKGQAVYGLTVGVGLNKDQKLFTADGKLSPEVLEASRAFNYNALRSHSAGVGEMMPVDLARLSMVVRLNTLLAGKSGAQVHVAELYRDMLNKNVTPLIPSEGSVGEADILLASHVGAVMIGEWKADVKGKVMTGADALKAAGIKPLQPEGKDALAILSNNSVAMAYAIDAARNAERIVEMTPTVYGLSLEGLNGNVAPILPQTIGARPFDGLSQTAADMRDVLKGSYLLRRGQRRQGRHHPVGQLQPATRRPCAPAHLDRHGPPLPLLGPAHGAPLLRPVHRPHALPHRPEQQGPRLRRHPEVLHGPARRQHGARPAREPLRHARRR